MIYLAYVAGLRGPEPQLWHKEKERDHFVTPSGLEVIGKPRLIPAEKCQSIDCAEAWHLRNKES
jgi:hypothetical protein